MPSVRAAYPVPGITLTRAPKHVHRAVAAACTQQGRVHAVWAEGKVVDGCRVGTAPEGEGLGTLRQPGSN